MQLMLEAHTTPRPDEVLQLEARLRLLSQITRSFLEVVREPQRLVDIVAQRLAETVGDLCSVSLLSDDATELLLRASHDPDPTALVAAREVAVERITLDRQPVLRHVLDTGEHLLIAELDLEQLRTQTTPRYHEFLRATGMHSMLIVPLRGRVSSIGVLVLMRHRSDRRPYGAHDVDLAHALADHAALAIETSHAFASEAAQRREAAKAHDALLESLEVNRQFFEECEIPIFAYAQDSHHIVAVNPAALELYGYTRAEFLTLSLRDLRRPEDHEVLEARARALGATDLRGATAYHRRKDGTIIEVEGGSHLSKFGDRPARFVTLVDVTERNAARNAQRRAEARLARLSESGILGIVVVSTQDDVLEVNNAVLELLGYTRDEMMTASFRWSSVTAPEWRSSVCDEPRELEYLGKDGRRLAVLTGAARLETGDSIRFILDLKGQKWAENAVRHLRESIASEAKFRTFLETAPDPIVIVDQSGTIALVNSRTEQVFGYDRAELVGHSVDMLVPDHVRPGHGAKVASYFAQPRVRMLGAGELTLLGRRKDGSEFPIEISLSPLETDQGMLVTSSIRDVSDRKAIDTALKHANRELESFSYSVAHDLRAPLRGMNGFANLLLDAYGDRLDEEGRDWLQEITRNAIRMAELVDALLSLSRLSRSELRPERVDLSELAETVNRELAAGEPDRAIDVRVEPGLRADLDPRLARVLVENLLGNARKYTRDRVPAEIVIGQTVSRGVPAFFVRDNGAGFDMAYAAKLFAPFQRLHAATEFAGTGIGLATVQRIVRRHGGEIWAEGAVGSGATFWFTLRPGPSGVSS